MAIMAMRVVTDALAACLRCSSIDDTVVVAASLLLYHHVAY